MIIEKDLIKLFALNKISKAELLNRYPVDLKEDRKYVLHLLDNAYDDQSEEDLEYALMLLPIDEFAATEKYATVLNRLILADWHCRHEDIASLLKGIKSPGSVDVLYKAALAQHDYLDYDDTYQLARKCIKALVSIGSDDAIEALRCLSKSETPEIAAYAQKELV